MIRLVLGPASAVNMRFAVSPALETVELVRFIARLDPSQDSHKPWVRKARQELPSLDVGELLDTVKDDAYCPEFLHPLPERTRAHDVFARQLEIVRSTSPAQVERELEMAYRTRPLDWVGSSYESALEVLADQLAVCYERIVKPLWPRVEAVARTDIRTRSDRISSHGLGAAIDELHPRLSMGGDAIEFTRSSTSEDEELPVGKEGVVLVPTVFGERCAAVGWAPAAPAQVMYWAKGSGLLWDTDNGGSALPDVLGSTRAALLAASLKPTTTKELAARLDIAPATVSYHLMAMSKVGWLNRMRIGRSVEYAATDLGRRILGERLSEG